MKGNREIVFVHGREKSESYAFEYDNHWPEKGLIGHIRMSLHVINGEKILVLEEAQADRFSDNGVLKIIGKNKEKVKGLLGEIKTFEEDIKAEDITTDTGRRNVENLKTAIKEREATIARLKKRKGYYSPEMARKNVEVVGAFPEAPTPRDPPARARAHHGVGQRVRPEHHEPTRPRRTRRGVRQIRKPEWKRPLREAA